MSCDRATHIGLSLRLGATVTPTMTASPLERLTTLVSADRRIISCYLALDPVRRNELDYPLELKDLAGEARREFEDGNPARENRIAVAADLDRLLKYVAQAANLPHAPAAAVFVCSALDLFEVIPLGRIAQPSVTIDRRPALTGVLAAERASAPMLLIVVDRNQARFFTLGPFAAPELPHLRYSGQSRGGRFHSDRGDAPGMGEKSFHGRREEEWRRHAARIWHRAEELSARAEIREVILGGNQDDIQALERDRPADSSLTIRGRTLLNPTALTEAMAFAAGSAQRAAARRLDDRALVKEMEEAVGTGSGVNGARETLRALIKGQLRTLLVPESQRGGGYRCPSTGEFVLAAADCESDSPPEPIADLISWIIPEALAKQVEVAVIAEAETAQAIDGLAGILRFR